MDFFEMIDVVDSLLMYIDPSMGGGGCCFLTSLTTQTAFVNQLHQKAMMV